MSESLNQLQPGTPVLLHDLQSRQDLNGRSASILKFDESKKRYHVTIDQSNQKSITVKPPNLLQRVQGVQVDTTTGETVLYAGSIVGARLENTTRLFSVQGSGESTWAPEEQLRFPPGTLVTITGVGRKPELNGTGGTIESWDSEARRYVIRRSASERIELRSNNVTLALGDAN